MKICIITEPLIFNYGGILQNYALQQYLLSRGHEVYTFDVGKFNWIDWLINVIAITFHKIKGEDVKYEMNPYQRMKREMPLRRFVYNHIALITPRQHKLNVKCLNKYHFDAIIVGSDQVWRPKYNSDIKDKFLSFAQDLNVKRVAYAASFGSDEWEFSKELTLSCMALIKRFDGVSIRESSGVDLCKKYLHCEAKHVLDPTLLLTREDYLSLCEHIKSRDRFIFAYILDYSFEKKKELEEFAKHNNFPILLVRAEDNLTKDDTIENWLSYFRDAEIIITDSFHGTAFSINFNKDFWVFGNEERGNARFISLLKMFNLESRMVNHLPLDNIAIKWSEVNNLLNHYRYDSSSWLTNLLQ
jgi:hypothetical protein